MAWRIIRKQQNTMETQPTLNTLTAESTAPRSRRLQDVRSAQDIARAQQIIAAVQNDTDLIALVAARGVDLEFIRQGTTLQANAQQLYNARQNAMSDARAAAVAYTDAADRARLALNDFRRTARTLFDDPPAQIALGLEGKYPNDLEQLLSTARSIYTAALSDPRLAAELARMGYSSVTLQKELDTLDAVIELRAERDRKQNAAVQATRDRDEALEALNAWLRRLRVLVRITARERPELARLVD